MIADARASSPGRTDLSGCRALPARWPSGARPATPPAVSAEPSGSGAKSQAVTAERWRRAECEHDLGGRATMGKRAEVRPTFPGHGVPLFTERFEQKLADLSKREYHPLVPL